MEIKRVAKLPGKSHELDRGSGSSGGWFYKTSEGVFGPLEFRQLRVLALEQRLLGHHRVWRESEGRAFLAEEMAGLIPSPRKIPESLPASKLSDDNPYATPRARTIADGPPGGLYLPHLRHAHFSALLASVAGTMFFGVAGMASRITETRVVFVVLSVMAFLIMISLSLTYLHRAWQMMSLFGAPLTGGKAVSFFLVPGFNALWAFLAVSGWAKIWNDQVRNHPGLAPAKLVWRWVFSLFPVFFLMSQGLVVMYLYVGEWPWDFTNQNHLLALMILGTSLAVGLTCWFQMCRSINFLATKKS